MSSYQIERWDVIMSNNNKVPMLYVKPDLTFLDFIKANNFSVVCEISNTNNNFYDKKRFNGVVNRSSNIPNCRPNFFEQTNLYVITLDSKWNGYPKDLGVVKFYGLKQPLLKTEVNVGTKHPLSTRVPISTREPINKDIKNSISTRKPFIKENYSSNNSSFLKDNSIQISIAIVLVFSYIYYTKVILK